MTAKLILGTANFGLTYGIANNKMLSEKEAFAILEKAVEVGVCCVDTARGYGDAEKVLGEFFKVHGKVFDVVTKLPDGDYRAAGDVEIQIETSLEHLCIGRIDTLLVHGFRSFERFSGVLLPVFERYRSAGIIGGYGLSVYHPYEIEKAPQAGFRIGAVQFPLNLFDQRFLRDGCLQKLGALGIALYGRSIFLQGLFFMDGASLGGHLQQATPKIKHLRSLARAYDTSVEALALLFAASAGVDYVVLGVDNAAQLERNAAIMANGAMNLLPELKDRFGTLEISDEEIILPYRWKR
jgi:aryl-alcohol dehydrogenase-like predicted oxidoreductase